ncbi:N-succinylarginine dihydrolase [Opitutales bacterium ASA1]|uniref:N-succinylarginine dihydrolase n=1 Tax=Congregicoccus parvus TaxID=3081749 RepID=UPI002B2FAF82|nr:N-succinylarginine dihydrolase [Opitutales bacterium ASA1]
MSDFREVNFDGLVGPTHNYAGLSHGNIASMGNRALVSNPREAALQGLAKMRLLASLGVPQALLPPQERPDVATLRRLGFSGTDAQVIERAARDAPHLLSAASSASAMWTANAATVAPSPDTADHRVHFTPANLVSKLHRSLEVAGTTRVLRAVFHDPTRFVVHDPLPAHPDLGDEGAANHTRLCRRHGDPGLHVFVHGRSVRDENGAGPARFPARQTAEATAAVARLNALAPDSILQLAQAPRAIDAGVFHNDVICVGNEHVLFVHEQAFADADAALDLIRRRFAARTKTELCVVLVRASQLSLDEVVRSYLFNGQLVTLPDGGMVLVAPAEVREQPRVAAYLGELFADPANPIHALHPIDLRQSMRNGGGPACLRLRVVLDAAERAALPPGVWIDDAHATVLENWVRRHYRESLAQEDLADPLLLEESRRALDALTQLLGLGSLYPFQQ